MYGCCSPECANWTSRKLTNSVPAPDRKPFACCEVSLRDRDRERERERESLSIRDSLHKRLSINNYDVVQLRPIRTVQTLVWFRLLLTLAIRCLINNWKLPIWWLNFSEQVTQQDRQKHFSCVIQPGWSWVNWRQKNTLMFLIMLYCSLPNFQYASLYTFRRSKTFLGYYLTGIETFVFTRVRWLNKMESDHLASHLGIMLYAVFFNQKQGSLLNGSHSHPDSPWVTAYHHSINPNSF